MLRLLIILVTVTVINPAHAVILETTPIKPLMIYKPVATAATNASLFSGAAAVAAQAASGFRAGFTPFNIGMTAAGVVVGTPIMYGMMRGMEELRLQAGAGNPQYTAPLSSVAPTSSGSGAFPTVSGTCTLGNTAIPLSTCLANMAAQGYTTPHAKYQTCNGSNCYYEIYYNNSSSGLEFKSSYSWYTVQSSACSYGSVDTNTGLCPPVPSCPAGYTLQGGNCTITDLNAVKYPSDGKPSYIISGGQFVPDPRDPDIATNPPVFPVDHSGVDDYGNPVHETITPNSANGVDYQRDTQGVNPQTGEPLVQRDRISTDSLGNVTSTTSITINNSTINNTNTNNIDTSKLNQEATQLQIKEFLNPQQSPDISQVDSAVQTATNNIVDQIANTPTNLQSSPGPRVSPAEYWTFASGTCFPATFDAGKFGVISLEKFCNIYDEHIRGLIVFILGVLGMLHAYAFWGEFIRSHRIG